MTEKSIIERIKRKDENGLQELLRHFGPLLRYVMKPILQDERDLEECIQDAAMKAWQEIDRFDESKGSWTGWLTTIARNLALNKARGATRHASSELLETEADSQPTPEEQVLARERQEALLRALQSLKEADRILFYRKYYYLQPVSQIAGELYTTERAIEGRLYRIKQKLKKQLEGEIHEKQ